MRKQLSNCMLCIVFNMPHIKQIDADTEICLHSNDKKIECGKTTRLLQELFEKEIASAYAAAEKQDNIQAQKYVQDVSKHDVQLLTNYKNTLWYKKPYAKVLGNSEEQEHVNGNNAMVTVTCWRHDTDIYQTTGLQRYGIRFQNGRLIVSVSGTYYIYSFLGLTEQRLTDEGIPVDSTKTQEIKHAMHKYSVIDDDDMEIASNVQSRKNTSRGNVIYYVSHIATSAYLHAGDEISVKISDGTLLKQTGSNYFGLHLV
ncbi:hypothetical protein MAR_013394 [Mya arenaria]|uniref:THD domain-containing protein n=1 Tax=Mya arenaria TaxID=6604 RepID=A0ABY7G0E4_MYAAR|nr:hypothetical protein MAR_013394 [Mya arenaria]